MARENFPACLNFTLKYEGGYVNHPKDPGGPTNMGITQNVLSGWLGRPATVDDVKKLSRSEAAGIYKANYWTAVRGDDLPAGIDLVVWDYGVNSGPTRAIKALQTALGVTVDGFIGAATIDAAKKADARDIVNKVCDLRQRFVRGLKTYATFGKGWDARIAACKKLATSMVFSTPSKPVPVPASDPPQEVQPKARASDESLMNSSTIKAGAGAAASGAAIAVREGVDAAKDAVDTSKSAIEIATTVGPWIILALVVVAFSVYIIWNRRNQIRSSE